MYISFTETRTNNVFNIAIDGRKVKATATFRPNEPNCWIADCHRGKTFATVQASDRATLEKKIAAVYK